MIKKIHILTKCSHPKCGLTRWNLRKCSGCGVARYCSTECQKECWETHKVECVMMKEKILKEHENQDSAFNDFLNSVTSDSHYLEYNSTLMRDHDRSFVRIVHLKCTRSDGSDCHITIPSSFECDKFRKYTGMPSGEYARLDKNTDFAVFVDMDVPDAPRKVTVIGYRYLTYLIENYKLVC